MNKKTIRISALILALAAAMVMLCACGSSKEKDVAAVDIAAKIDEALEKGDSLVEVDDNYIKGFMKMDVAGIEHVVKINAYGANIDEYGVFKASDSTSSKQIKEMLEAYLKLRLDSWMDEYMPEEKPKLSSAEIKVNGSYVVYCVLSDADKTKAFDAFEGMLK